MRIGIIGAGRIGATLARLLVGVGHEVAIANSRGPETLRDLVAELGSRARAVRPEEAARTGQLVIVSIPLGRYRELPREALSGRIVVDTNNYSPDRDGRFPQLDDGSTTSSELLADHLGEARVVKAFNAIFWEHLRDQGKAPGERGRIGIPISGDDELAKLAVEQLIDQIGFDAVDAGGLAGGGRRHQPGTPAYNADVTTDELRARLAG